MAQDRATSQLTMEGVPLMAKSGQINMKNLVTLISVGVLVGTEFIGVAIAAGWAIAGLFQLGNTIALVLMMAFGAVSLYALYEFMKRAVSLEPIRG
jgi:hypothetical protein